MKQGDVGTPIILWLTSILAISIMVLWYLQTGNLHQFDIRSVDEDLKNLRYELSLACTYSVFENNLPIYSTKGTLVINESSMCISQGIVQNNITRCLPTPCLVLENTIELLDKSVLRIVKTPDGVLIE